MLFAEDDSRGDKIELKVQDCKPGEGPIGNTPPKTCVTGTRAMREVSNNSRFFNTLVERRKFHLEVCHIQVPLDDQCEPFVPAALIYCAFLEGHEIPESRCKRIEKNDSSKATKRITEHLIRRGHGTDEEYDQLALQPGYKFPTSKDIWDAFKPTSARHPEPWSPSAPPTPELATEQAPPKPPPTKTPVVPSGAPSTLSAAAPKRPDAEPKRTLPTAPATPSTLSLPQPRSPAASEPSAWERFKASTRKAWDGAYCFLADCEELKPDFDPPPPLPVRKPQQSTLAPDTPPARPASVVGAAPPNPTQRRRAPSSDGFIQGGLSFLGSFLGGIASYLMAGSAQKPPAAPPLQPLSAAPSVASASIVASPALIDAGETARLSWSSVGIRYCTLVDATLATFAPDRPDGTTASPALTSSARFGIICDIENSSDVFLNEVLVRVRGDATDPPPIFVRIGRTVNSPVLYRSETVKDNVTQQGL